MELQLVTDKPSDVSLPSLRPLRERQVSLFKASGMFTSAVKKKRLQARSGILIKYTVK
jgi:hypothetical protein